MGPLVLASTLSIFIVILGITALVLVIVVCVLFSRALKIYINKNK